MQLLDLVRRFDYRNNPDPDSSEDYPYVFPADSRLYRLPEDGRHESLTALNAAAQQIKTAEPPKEIAAHCQPWTMVQTLLAQAYTNLADAFRATLPA